MATHDATSSEAAEPRKAARRNRSARRRKGKQQIGSFGGKPTESHATHPAASRSFDPSAVSCYDDALTLQIIRHAHVVCVVQLPVFCAVNVLLPPLKAVMSQVHAAVVTKELGHCACVRSEGSQTACSRFAAAHTHTHTQNGRDPQSSGTHCLGLLFCKHRNRR